METIPQFGVRPPGEYKERISSYAIVLNVRGQLLTLKVGDGYHLPGGGIDPGEDPKRAAIREAKEEAGCEISNLVFIGKADQYFLKSEGGPLNKVAAFYGADMITIDPTKSAEVDHEVSWLTPEQFLNSSADEFQRWAVKKALHLE